jgi:hypothetical protein
LVSLYNIGVANLRIEKSHCAMSLRECASFPQRVMPVCECFYVCEIKARDKRWKNESDVAVLADNKCAKLQVIFSVRRHHHPAKRNLRPVLRSRPWTHGI